MDCGSSRSLVMRGMSTPDALPEDAARLFYLTLSLAEVSFAVEQFGQPSVVDGYDVKRFVVVERN